MVDPAFLHFFERVFPRRLDVEIPGMPDASWDRKAAYLLWRSEQRTAVELDDNDLALLG